MRRYQSPLRDRLVQELAIKSKFPNFDCRNEKGALVITGALKPKETSCAYTLWVEYHPRQHPTVTVLSPPLHQMAPHRLSNGSLCLVNPTVRPWRSGDLVAKLTLPWSALWLYYYEGWLNTGIWYGPEAPHNDAGIRKN